jgi:hypothetical protein
VGGIKGGVRRHATPAVAVLIAMLAVLLLAAPTGSAATGSADAGQAAVTSAVQATAESQAAPEAPGASDRLHALPPLRHHLVKVAVARHRSGGHPLPALLGRAAMFLLPAGVFLLVPRCARATQAPPGRLAMSYPMRT